MLRSTIQSVSSHNAVRKYSCGMFCTLLISLLCSQVHAQTINNLISVCRSHTRSIDGLYNVGACAELYKGKYRQHWMYLRYGQLLENDEKLEEARKVYLSGLIHHDDSSKLSKKLEALDAKIAAANPIKPSTDEIDLALVNRCARILIDGMGNEENPETPEECKQFLNNQDTVSDQPIESGNQSTESASDTPSDPDSDTAKADEATRGATDVGSIFNDTLINYGNYYALVIGNNNYQNFTKLKTAVNDAKTVTSLLQSRYGFNVNLLENATRFDVLSALSKLRSELGPDDNLLIYYAGHGNVDTGTGRGYWLPVDAEEDNPANWIANDDITTQLKAILAKHVLVVADSCYSATLTRSINLNPRTGGTEEWIKRMVNKRSRTVLTSGGLEPVVDSGKNNHSVFANAFIDALSNNLDTIDMDALFGPIKRRVVLQAQQTPVYSDIRFTDHEDGDFIFKLE